MYLLIRIRFGLPEKALRVAPNIDDLKSLVRINPNPVNGCAFYRSQIVGSIREDIFIYDGTTGKRIAWFNAKNLAWKDF